jgi:hypothetical protein
MWARALLAISGACANDLGEHPGWTIHSSPAESPDTSTQWSVPHDPVTLAL